MMQDKRKDMGNQPIEPKHGDLKKALKAYDNKHFIHSNDGRTIRILSEYLYPEQYFRRHKIDRSIVFFGSARTVSKEDVEKNINDTKENIKVAKKPDLDFLMAELRKYKRLRNLSRYYDDAVVLSRRLSAWSKTLPKKSRFYICTGGGPGMMEAANKGAYLEGQPTIGLNISLPFEQYPNQYITPDLNFEFHYFFMRKFWFVKSSKAVIAMPGGFGTMDELFEILTLKQTGKLSRPLPVILYGKEFWSRLVDFDYFVDMGVIDRKDTNLFKILDTPDEAFDYLTNYLTEIYNLK